MRGRDGWGGWWLDGVDGEVVSGMDGWEVVDEWVGVRTCGSGMDGVRMDDRAG